MFIAKEFAKCLLYVEHYFTPMKYYDQQKRSDGASLSFKIFGKCLELLLLRIFKITFNSLLTDLACFFSG